MIATVIVDAGIFLVLGGLAFAILMVARVAKTVKAHLPGIEIEVGQVNRAVNCVGPGEQSLIQQVREMRGLMIESYDVVKSEFESIHKRLDTLENSTLNRAADNLHRE